MWDTIGITSFNFLLRPLDSDCGEIGRDVRLKNLLFFRVNFSIGSSPIGRMINRRGAFQSVGMSVRGAESTKSNLTPITHSTLLARRSATV